MKWGELLFKSAVLFLETAQKVQQEAQARQKTQQKAQTRHVQQQQQNLHKETVAYDKEAKDREHDRLFRQVKKVRAAYNPDPPSRTYASPSAGNSTQTCPTCKGTRVERCSICDGKGYYFDHHGQQLDCVHGYRGQKKCATCEGSGRV